MHLSSKDLRRALLLLVTGISLYLLLPSLLAVFSSVHTLQHLDWIWVLPAVVAEAVSFAAIWELDRIALRTQNRFAVASSQLAGNAVGRVVPGGAATATATSVSMLRRAGIDSGEAVTALSASSLLQTATTLALPLLALPALIGAPVRHGLAVAAYLGLAVALLLLIAGGVAFTTDAPLRTVGRAAQWLINKTVRRERPISGLPNELIADRDFIRKTLGEHWRGALVAATASAGFEYLALLCALRAVGADPRPSLVLLAYVAGELLALIPITPGGLGFVEAGLVGTLTLAGVSGPDALAATLVYRLISYWLPLPAGGIAYWLFQRRYGRQDSRTGSSVSGGGSRDFLQALRESADESEARRGDPSGMARAFMFTSALRRDAAAWAAAASPTPIDLVVTSPTDIAREAGAFAVGARWVRMLDEPLFAARADAESGADVLARIARGIRGLAALEATAPLVVFESLDVLGAGVFVLDEDGLMRCADDLERLLLPS